MAKTTGLQNICIHTWSLEKTLKLYREILKFELVDSRVFSAEQVKGMLVLDLKAGNCLISISLPSPELMHTVYEIGNNNHNHFMLLVDDIAAIAKALEEEGYKLENKDFTSDKSTFFEGPNGEIIGLIEK